MAPPGTTMTRSTDSNRLRIVRSFKLREEVKRLGNVQVALTIVVLVQIIFNAILIHSFRDYISQREVELRAYKATDPIYFDGEKVF